MKKKIKYIIIKSILLYAVFSQRIGVHAAASNIQIQLNQQLISAINPIVEEGTTLVPLRSIGTLLGAVVDWDDSTKTISITQANRTNTLRLNETTAYKEDENGKTKIELAVAPKIEKGTSYVPLRYIAESLDIEVGWQQATNTITINESFEYKNQKIFWGADTKEVISLLGNPSFTMEDETYEYLFYIDDYKNVLVLYSADDVIVGFTSNAKTIKVRDISYHDKKESHMNGLTILRDSHDDNKVVGMGYNMTGTSGSTKAAILANERIIFELTNGFRAHNNIKPLQYSSKLSDVARKHSKDMADFNYFSHTSLDGTTMSERITRGGINWSSCGENIAAGDHRGLCVFGLWLNSLGHRKNMLEQSGELGVGSAYNEKSSSHYYHTQNFARTF